MDYSNELSELEKSADLGKYQYFTAPLGLGALYGVPSGFVGYSEGKKDYEKKLKQKFNKTYSGPEHLKRRALSDHIRKNPPSFGQKLKWTASGAAPAAAVGAVQGFLMNRYMPSKGSYRTGRNYGYGGSSDNYRQRYQKYHGNRSAGYTPNVDSFKSVLGLSGNEKTKAEVKKRFRQMAMTHHPDRGGSEEKMKAINNAYDQIQKTDWFSKLAYLIGEGSMNSFWRGFSKKAAENNAIPARFTIYLFTDSISQPGKLHEERFKEVIQNYNEADLKVVDLQKDRGNPIAMRFEVKSTPTVLVFKQGYQKPFEGYQGTKDKFEIKRFLDASLRGMK